MFIDMSIVFPAAWKRGRVQIADNVYKPVFQLKIELQSTAFQTTMFH